MLATDPIKVGIGDRGWVKGVLAALVGARNDEEDLLPLPVNSLSKEMRVSALRLGYEDCDHSPHILRHSGPGNDRWQDVLSLPEIMKRGRWASLKPVSRYEKHGRLLKILDKVTARQQGRMRKRSELLPRLLTRALCALSWK